MSIENGEIIARKRGRPKKVPNKIIEDDLDVTIEPEIVEDKIDYYSLKKEYLQFKNEDSNLVSTDITDSYILKDINEIDALITDAYIEIETLSNKGVDENIIKSTKNKLLNIIDPNKKWIGKVVDKGTENLKVESIKQKNMKQIISELVKNVNKKRDEVVEYIDKVEKANIYIINRLKIYNELDSKIDSLLKKFLSSKEKLDAQKLSINIKKTITNMNSDISRQEKLILAMELNVTEIDNSLPDIEYELNVLSGMKIPEQSMNDLYSVGKKLKELSTTFRSKVQDSINTSLVNSLELVTASNIDIEELKMIQKKENETNEKIVKLVSLNMEKVNKDLIEISKLKTDNLLSNKKYENLLLSSENKSDFGKRIIGDDN